jgi:hypothetical protein
MTNKPLKIHISKCDTTSIAETAKQHTGHKKLAGIWV